MSELEVQRQSWEAAEHDRRCVAKAAADVVDEAEEEHQHAKLLIAQILEVGAADKTMDQLVADLARAIEDHVKEERDELFPKARSAPGLDLAALGMQLKERQVELQRPGGAAGP